MGLRGSSFRRRPRLLRAEINVTPMVDVMLVLLVIFMVSTPLMHHGVPVNLPSSTSPPLQEKEEPVVVTLNDQKKLFVGDTPLTEQTLPAELRKMTRGQQDPRIYLRADTHLSYGDVMQAMHLIQEAGYSKIALVNENRLKKR